MTMQTTPDTSSAPMRPPRATTGPVAWLRDNLFSSVGNTILTVIGAWLVYKALSSFTNWAFISAVWTGNDGAACSVEGAGACWPFIKAKYQQFLYGRYPEAERWRVNLTYVFAVAGLVALMVPRIPGKALSAVFTLFVFPIIAYWLLTGSSPSNGFDVWDGLGFLFLAVAIVLLLAPGVLGGRIPAQLGRLIGTVSAVLAAPMLARWLFSSSGLINLPIVETELWGGLLITLVVASVGIAASFPIGIVLALGRRSKMPIVRWVSVAFIEFIRGVPLITMLFMASVMLPLFLPPNVTFDKLLRALVGVAIFSGAYMAEVIRGGLQAIPRGQFEAGEALGLSYWQRTGLIVLPQALKLVIPGIVNSFIGLFKDTSLVLIIGLFDLLGIVQLNQSDSKWFSPTTAMTGYFFAGALFWVFCFGMSRYSLYMERRLDTGHKS